jgi:hypothetical protein
VRQVDKIIGVIKSRKMAARKTAKAVPQKPAPTVEENIDIRKFEPDRMRKNKIVLVIGPQYSGKTSLLHELLYFINPSFPILADPNEFATGYYGGILPKQCKKEQLDNDWLEKFCTRQRTLLEFNKQNRRNLDISAGLILDHAVPDMIDLKWERNPNFKFLFTTGKEAHTSLIMTAPYPLKMPSHYLSSIDYVFMLRETNKANKKKLFDMFGGMFGRFEYFEEVFDQCTENYRALVIDQTCRTSDLTDRVFWYRAPERPRQFRLGNPRLWQICYNTSISLDDLLTKPLMMYETRPSNHKQSRYLQ